MTPFVFLQYISVNFSFVEFIFVILKDTYFAKPKRVKTWYGSSELKKDEEEWEEDEFSSLDTADENAASDDGNFENRIISKKLFSVWSKLSPLVQEIYIVFYLGFLSQPFTNHRTVGGREREFL